MIDPKYKKSDQILEVYSEFGNIGIWFFDRQTGYEEVSEEWAAMLGYKADDLNPMTKEKFLNLIHPEDCQRSKEKIETLYSGGYISYENEFRLKHQDGHYVWVLSQAKVFSWENDKPKMIIGTHINIENQKKQLEKIKKQNIAMVSALSKVIELKDMYTKNHLEGVADISVEIGQRLGLDEDVLEQLWIAGHLHDLGKVQVPTEILNKAGKLTLEEYEVVKKHPEFGYEILKNLDFGFSLAEVVSQHHERNDGSGYPKGLKDDEIFYLAKIVSVADVVNAMMTDRPYRNRLSNAEVIETLLDAKGTHFDSEIVDACCRYIRLLPDTSN